MSDHPITRPRPTRHLFLVPALTADEVDATSEPSADDNADPPWTWLVDGLDTPATTARHYVTEILSRWNLATMADTATVVVTELVSKVTRRTKPPVALTIGMDKTTRPPTLEISVTAGDPTPAVGREPSEHGGSDLLFVHGLADLGIIARENERGLTVRIPCA